MDNLLKNGAQLVKFVRLVDLTTIKYIAHYAKIECLVVFIGFIDLWGAK